MIEFFRELTIFQWLLFGVGVFLAFPVVKDFLTKNNETPDSPPLNHPIKNVDKANALTSIVYKWEVLYNACSDMDLLDAQQKLEEVFPMFARLRNHQPEPKKQNWSENEQ